MLSGIYEADIKKFLQIGIDSCNFKTSQHIQPTKIQGKKMMRFLASVICHGTYRISSLSYVNRNSSPLFLYTPEISDKSLL